MTVLERFLSYVAIDTRSDDTSTAHPSSANQFDLARLLFDELQALGAHHVRMSEHCYVYAEIPPTQGYEDKPTLGFIAHMDTSPDFSGKGVTPQLIPDYQGGDIPLGTSGRVLSPAMFPHLSGLVGKTLITTDGTTLLGADDKAGVAEIMTLAETLLAGSIPHGKVVVAFTPDEEVGAGADLFDVEGFGADFAYTVDGGAEGGMEYENFNAASASFTVTGVNVHPGYAKDTMVNAALVATELAAMLPKDEIPSKTEGYEGFFHLTDIEGTVEKATLHYIVRDHDFDAFDRRKQLLADVVTTLNARYGEGCVTLTLKDSYRNMKEMIAPCMHLIENARLAAERVGVTPTVEPIRGGTDGARLSYMGLPCPNLGTGGYAFHGPYEHITKEGLEAESAILCEIVKLYAKGSANG
ncbi:MAG: peptidase T [Clostridia bacterium]|nr:peptidase T [Clostridia bacterium]